MSENQIKKLLILSFLINLTLVLFYFFSTLKIDFNTDHSTKILLAQEILNTNDFFPNGWSYGNGDIWIVFQHLLLVPLVKFWGLNYQTYAVNSVIYLVFYLSSVCYFLAKLDISKLSKWFFISVSILCLSNNYASLVFGDAGYYSVLFITLFLIMGLTLDLLKNPSEKINKFIFITSILLLLLTVHNPLRTFVYQFLPLIFIGIYLYFYKEISDVQFKKIIYSWLIVFILGSIVYLFLSQYLIVVKGNSDLSLSQKIIENFFIYLTGWQDLLGLTDVSNKPLVFSLAHILIFCLLSYLVISFFRNKSQKYQDRLVMWVFLYFLISLTLLFIFKANLAIDVNSFRYLYVLYILLLLIAVIGLDKLSKITKQRVYILCSILIVILNIQVFLKPGQIHKFKHEEVAKYLEESKLEYGFATFWNSYVINVIIDNKVKVFPVRYWAPNNMGSYNWLSTTSWYKQKKYSESFLLLTNDEFAEISEVIHSIAPPKSIKRIGDFVIVEFDFNISSIFTIEES